MINVQIKYLHRAERKQYLHNAAKLKALYERLERYFYVVEPYCPSVHIKDEIEKILEEQFKIVDKAKAFIEVKGNKAIADNKFKDGFYEMQPKSYYKMAAMIKSVSNTKSK